MFTVGGPCVCTFGTREKGGEEKTRDEKRQSRIKRGPRVTNRARGVAERDSPNI